MDDLFTLGFGPFFERQLEDLPGNAATPARIAAEHRGAYEVWSVAGSHPARLTGRLRRELETVGLPGVGDWVTLSEPTEPNCPAVIDRVLRRRTVFTRGAAGRQAREQVVAANVDLVFAVSGLDTDFNLRRIERYLARIWASGAVPCLVFTKADLCPDVWGRVAEASARFPGVPVCVVSAPLGEGVAELRASIRPGETAALVGSSGVGKSTLVNALLGEQRMRTGAVRAADGRGCHVTTHRQLVILSGGGVLLDTPGMRELELAGEDGLDAVFGDIAALAAGCRFRDCRHDSEPGCAVREAVASGGLDPARLEHYRALEREARAFERRTDERLRRQEGRRWGQLSDEVARLRRWKGGKE